MCVELSVSFSLHVLIWMLIFTLVRYFGGSVFNENCQMLKGNRFLCDSQFNNFPVNIKWSKYNTDISHHRSASPALLTIELWCCSSSSINTNSSIPYISANSNSNATSTPSLDYFMPEHRICVTELKFERCPCAHKQRTRLWNGTYIHTHTSRRPTHVGIFQSKWMRASLSANFMKCELPVFNYWAFSHLKVWN